MPAYTISQHTHFTTEPVSAFSESGFFFNDWAFLKEQHAESFWQLAIRHLPTNRLVARCSFFVKDNQLVSPLAAPFGSIEFIETVSDEALTELLQTLENHATMCGLSTIRLTQYPRCYAPVQFDRLASLLLKNEFEVIEQVSTFYIPVIDAPLPHRIHLSERRHLRKCRQAGFQFRLWETPCINSVIMFITESRQQQGYALTLPIERLQQLLVQFPEKYPVFVITDGSVICSLTVAVRINSSTLYSFLPADNQAYRSYSPAVMLIEGMYQYCQQHHINLLDLGTALDSNRQPKPSLVCFKQHMGALPSPKFTVEKHVAHHGEH